MYIFMCQRGPRQLNPKYDLLCYPRARVIAYRFPGCATPLPPAAAAADSASRVVAPCPPPRANGTGRRGGASAAVRSGI